MNQAQYKAAVNATIRTYRLAGKKVNISDVLYEAELEQIRAERHASNGNGSEPERIRFGVPQRAEWQRIGN